MSGYESRRMARAQHHLPSYTHLTRIEEGGSATRQVPTMLQLQTQSGILRRGTRTRSSQRLHTLMGSESVSLPVTDDVQVEEAWCVFTTFVPRDLGMGQASHEPGSWTPSPRLSASSGRCSSFCQVDSRDENSRSRIRCHPMFIRKQLLQFSEGFRATIGNHQLRFTLLAAEPFRGRNTRRSKVPRPKGFKASLSAGIISTTASIEI
ncbi:hypothetical protein V8C26DRAFT_392088 [Trichoderma gracile]